MEAATPISTGAKPGPFDGLESAKPDEPVFTLQGGDPLAPGLVLEWVKQRRTNAVKRQSDAIESGDQRSLADAEEDLERCTAAEQIAWAMKDYARGETVQPEKSAEQVATSRGQGCAEVVEHISEADYHLHAAAQIIASFGPADPLLPAALKLTSFHEELGAIREQVRPAPEYRKPRKE